MEQVITIQNIPVNYKITGQGSLVILLHGWGCDLHIFKHLQASLETNYQVISIDLPGFGKTPPPQTVWGIEEYTRFFEIFVAKLSLSNFALLGHSFGGRMAILYASRNPVKKVILANSAGVRVESFKTLLSKGFSSLKSASGKIIGEKNTEKLAKPLAQYLSSSDFANAGGIMKEILKKIVSEDLQHVMPLIKAPVLLIWGDIDTATPLHTAQTMEKLIPDAGLVVFKNCGHYSFIDKQNEFLIVLLNFLKTTNG